MLTLPQTPLKPELLPHCKVHTMGTCLYFPGIFGASSLQPHYHGAPARALWCTQRCIGIVLALEMLTAMSFFQVSSLLIGNSMTGYYLFSPRKRLWAQIPMQIPGCNRLQLELIVILCESQGFPLSDKSPDSRGWDPSSHVCVTWPCTLNHWQIQGNNEP